MTVTFTPSTATIHDEDSVFILGEDIRSVAFTTAKTSAGASGGKTTEGNSFVIVITSRQHTTPIARVVLAYVTNQPSWTNSVAGAQQAVADFLAIAGITGSAIVADGNYGDVTVSGSGTTWTINNGVVTVAKMDSGAAASGEVATADGAGNVTWAPATGGGLPPDADYGDITVSGVGTVWTIDPDAVTNAKLAGMAQGLFKMRAAGAGTGNPIDGTANQASTILDGATDPFVRTSAAATGDVVGPASAIDSAIALYDGTTGKLIKDSGIGIANTSTASAVIQALGTGKIDLSWIPDSILGQVEYMGVWDATTNTPTLANPPALSTKGEFYIVSVAGTQFGIPFAVGDWIISDGTQWSKVDNTDAVASVFGRIGAILAVAGDYSANQITNVPAGNIAATDVQGAINELDTEKLAIASLGTNVGAFLATPSSANLAAALTDETGSGAAVFATSPTLVTPALGTPSTLVLTNATGLPPATGLVAPYGVFLVNQRNMGVPVCLYGTSSTLTNQANALAFISAVAIPPIDLTGFTEIKFAIGIQTASASANTPKVILRYFSSWSTTTTDYLDIGTSEVSVSMSAVGPAPTAWIPLAAGAIANNRYLRLLVSGGDGAQDPVTGIATIFLR